MATISRKEHADELIDRMADELIDRMAPGQVSVVVNLLEMMPDPLSRSLANALFDDVAISDEENRAVAASRAWLKDNEPTPHAKILAKFGLTQDDFDRMGRTPLDPSVAGE